MKNCLICLALSLALLLACNTPATKTTVNNDTIGKTVAVDVAKPAGTKDTAYDPDPTDSISGSMYGINSSSKKTAGLVRRFLNTLLKTDIEKNTIDSTSRKFIFFEYDLNDDGSKEIFVGLNGSYFCGSGGCTFYLLNNLGNVKSRFTVADYPVIISKVKTNGWQDLFILSNGQYHIAKYDGRKYPSNPSVEKILKQLPGDELPRALDYTHEPYAWFQF